MKKYTSQISILIIGFLLATATSYLSAWTGAPTNPPNNNTPAPINVGNSNQIKLGTLGLGGLSVFGVGQVSTSSYTLPPKLAFGVNGSVGAREYCDQNGQNCSRGPDEKIICTSDVNSSTGGWYGKCFTNSECQNTSRTSFNGCVGVANTISASGGVEGFQIIQHNQSTLSGVANNTNHPLVYGGPCPLGGFNIYRNVGGTYPNNINININPYGSPYSSFPRIYASAVYFCPRQ